MTKRKLCALRKRGVCGAANCAECRPRSFAAYPNIAKVAAWSKLNEKQPSQVPMNSKDLFKLDCSECNHTFGIRPNDVVQGQWCGFCANQKLCDDIDCTICFDKSLASFDNPEKMSQWSPNNKLTARQIFKGSGKQVVLFDCNDCKHEFKIQPNDLTRNKRPRWCSYCGGQALCKAEDCDTCFQRSFASFDAEKVACWDTERNNGVTPRELFKSSSSEIWFTCDRCPHSFRTPLNNITSHNTWCPFCCNNSSTICGKPECTFCKKPCVVCLLQEMMVVGQRQTPDGLLCTPCYIRSPHCTPKQRAKISMEMQVIHGLHDLINKTPGSYMFRELTSWDCPVLPGLSFKPDLLWAFDAVGNCFTTAGSCSLSLEQVTHLMSVEVLEHGRQQHSDDRKIPDAVRELKMREDLPVVPFCVIYVTVANNSYHTTAHAEDVFFTKINNDTEYSIIPERKAAWNARIKLLLRTMMQAREAVSNETIWIGH